MTIRINSKHVFCSMLMMVILLFCSKQVQADQSGYYTYIVIDNKAEITEYHGAGGAVLIPDTLGGFTVTAIGNNAFWCGYGISSISIPQSVTSIGDGAFSGCPDLTSIIVDANNSSLSSIDGVLYDKGKTVLIACPKAQTSITIPESVTSIDNTAFAFCKDLTSVIIPQGVVSIGSYAFHSCTSLASITIPQGISGIGESAFSYCSGLTSITLPQSVTSIGPCAFSNCTALKSINLSEGVSVIGSSTFWYCSELININLPKSLTSIGSNAFGYCTSLVSITIPQGVINIGDFVFSGCSELTSIEVDTNNSTYASEGGLLLDKAKTTLIQCPGGLTRITIPQSVTNIVYGAFFYCSELSSIEVDTNNSTYASEGGLLLDKAETTLIQCPGGLTSINIPQGVTSIGSNALWYCTELTSITNHLGLTSIGYRAFYYCTKLTDITISSNATNIADQAFFGCTALASITFNSATVTIYDSSSTIPATTKIIGYDPSTAKDYATKYNRTFEMLSSSAIIFADPNLEAVVRDEVSKPEGPITAADVENIYELSIFGRGITSLDGVQNLTNLKGLYAWGNPITDITPLQQLPNLQWLDLENTQISNYSPLNCLTKLEELCLAYNNLTLEALSNLSGLLNLTVLNLRSNMLNDNNRLSLMSTESSPNPGLSSLSQLTKLLDLDLSDNGITNVDALSSLTKLSELNLANNQISNITPISNLTDIQKIDLSNNQINDISPLESLNKIESINISSNQIGDISSLSSLNNITTLNLSGNNITSIEPLSNLSNLQNVYITDNDVTDLSPLQNLPNIEEYNSDDASCSPENWEPKSNVALDKEWNIRFNLPIASDSINLQNVFVKDASGARVTGVSPEPGIDNFTISVKPPEGGYTPGQSYYLYISNNIKSLDGKQLNSPVKMGFNIVGGQANTQSVGYHSAQSALDSIFFVKDIISFGYGLTNLVDKTRHEAEYLRQLPADHFIPTIMTWNFDGWNNEADFHLLTLYGQLFNNSSKLQLTTAETFVAELGTLTSTIYQSIYTMDIPWWATDLFRPIKEAGQALTFMSNWNKIRDGKVILGSNLKLSSNSKYEIGENSTSPLKLTMKFKPKWEFKYLLGRPVQEIPIAESEQALWVSENPNIATVYKGVVTGHSPGTATIKVKFYNKTAKINIKVE